MHRSFFLYVLIYKYGGCGIGLGRPRARGARARDILISEWSVMPIYIPGPRPAGEPPRFAATHGLKQLKKQNYALQLSPLHKGLRF